MITDKINNAIYECFWVPESKHRQNESILDDSTEDAEDTGDDILVNSIQSGRSCRRSIRPKNSTIICQVGRAESTGYCHNENIFDDSTEDAKITGDHVLQNWENKAHFY